MPWTETIDVNTGEVKRFYLRAPGEPRRTVRVVVDPARSTVSHRKLWVLQHPMEGVT